MSITKYTNIDDINNKSSNEGKFIQADDLFIVSKNEIEKTDFGMGRYDVMEVSVYDINNNLLPQKSGNNVAYIRKGDIQNYLYNITNKVGQKELAINIEKLLNDIGFRNGILKVNINFVKQKVGSENELMKVWIQEVSPSRNEIRILPLKTKDSNINATTNRQFKNLKSLNKDFLYYKTSILDSLNAYENSFLTKIDSYLQSKFGNNFFAILRKDFGLSKFDTFRTKIFEDFKLSVGYYLTNKYYNIGESNFGKQSETRFDDFEVYDYDVMLNEIQKILNNCIDNNSKILKRRSIETKQLPKEFAITELQKQIQNNLESFSTFTETKINVYSPTGEVAVFDDSNLGIKYPAKGVLLSTLCKGYDQYGKYADGSGGSYEQLIASNSSNCGYTPPPPPGGGGSGGGGSTGGGGSSSPDGPRGEEVFNSGLGKAENIR
jgi:uncharacterized membrane protein YgcG